MFDGFALDHYPVGEVTLRTRVGGEGPAVLLLHGHPRTHVTWHKVAPLLVAGGYTVVCPDLRGYGQSSKPTSARDHSTYTKRAMAQDMVGLMAKLGHTQFAVVGHDRGAYVAHRLAMDHPEVVTHLAVLDAVPIGEALASCDVRFASAWWHWFFLGQTAKPAERVINADPDGWYQIDPSHMGPEAYADLRESLHDPATVHAMCEDYRAGLGLDRAADDDDRANDRKVSCPTLVVWATRDDMPMLYGNPVAVWQRWASHVIGIAVPSGHHIAEEAPDALASVLRPFLRG
ncbi:MAG TPA: alpha/beta hydrolase [Micromonosporaceae bacterium]|nr:alpha/beta hydrolase [Micromonosporaceae bacterium]